MAAIQSTLTGVTTSSTPLVLTINNAHLTESELLLSATNPPLLWDMNVALNVVDGSNGAYYTRNVKAVYSCITESIHFYNDTINYVESIQGVELSITWEGNKIRFTAQGLDGVELKWSCNVSINEIL